MKDTDPNYSRMDRKKRHNKNNKFLNIMIGIVVVLILIVGATLIIGPKDEDKKDIATDNTDVVDENNEDSEDETGLTLDDVDEPDESDNQEAESDKGSEDDGGTSSSDTGSSDEPADEEEEDQAGNVTIVPNDEEIIEQSIVDSSWQPIGTDQSGEHVSQYDAESTDYNEKKRAIAYATGFSEDELFYKRVKNGGGPQKSIGIVTTKDGSKIFRVYIEWIDEKGWKPVKMDVLKTLDFEY
ncbi:putative membrane protein YrrS [Sporosarcina luteola]|uniref:Putative membrane protein YrrS n=1 Tax=Sporosarcina luteola TaxID=582850 RepID=A0A511ZB46_9BACL|nr:YrrS family protein [Sporosarcina luteola]GEN84664.1 putative membrane protein YrrS [Sporosarcina luteola]